MRVPAEQGVKEQVGEGSVSLLLARLFRVYAFKYVGLAPMS